MSTMFLEITMIIAVVFGRLFLLDLWQAKALEQLSVSPLQQIADVGFSRVLTNKIMWTSSNPKKKSDWIKQWRWCTIGKIKDIKLILDGIWWYIYMYNNHKMTLELCQKWWLPPFQEWFSTSIGETLDEHGWTLGIHDQYPASYGGFLSHRGTPHSSSISNDGIFPLKTIYFGYPHGYGNPHISSIFGPEKDESFAGDFPFRERVLTEHTR